MDSAPKVAARWVSAIEAMQKHGSRVYPMRYESLVRDPTRELSALGDWLEVDPAGFSTEEVRASSVGKYKTSLSSEEIDQVLEIAGPTMQSLGYL